MQLENSPLSQYTFDEVYEASRGDLVHDFYIPALNRASRYDRAVGYFRSSVFYLIGVALSEFALRDSKMRIICSPSLTTEDENTVRMAHRTSDEQIARGIERDIERAIQDVQEHSVLQLLATLLQHEILHIKLTFKPDLPGIFHTKVGTFSAGDAAMSFSGSANETYMAWAGNEERFHAFCSWRSDYESRQVKKDQNYFDRLWASKIPDLTTKDLPDVSRDLLQQHALKNPEEAVERVRLAHDSWHRGPVNARRGWALQKHQADSRNNWWQNRAGIVCYVTGGGKTITALAIMRDWFRREDTGSVVILVPSNLLARQWRAHLEEEEPRLRVLQVGGEDSQRNWRQLIGDYTRAARLPHRRVVLAVLNSAAKSDFVEKARVGAHTLLIADEVHRIGARHFRRVLHLDAGGRLGLSATPERFGDPVGTAAVLDYFGARLKPEFTIQDAQRCVPPRLVPYAYYPETVALTAPELEEYRKYSQRIAELSARSRASGNIEDEERLRLALIQRAKVLKGASGKAALGLEVISTHYEEGARWLVYCDDTDQLERLLDALKEAGYRPLKYYAAMAFSKEATISRFEKLGGILLSINCLDEGVDIPSITHAMILASSVNPRQYIQRRGRVLRVAEGKVEATIYDALVRPDGDQPRVVFDQDLRRAKEFALDAANARTVARRLGAYVPFSEAAAAPWVDFEGEYEEKEGGQE